MISKGVNDNSNSCFPGNILLVEDNPADIRLIQEELKDEHNKKLYAVNDGTHALDYLYKKCRLESNHCPNLIILDLNLPKMSGIEF